MNKRITTRRTLRLTVSVWMCLALAAGLWGCAAQTAYREGQERAAEGHWPQALQRFAEAARLEPGSAQYRIAELRARDRLVTDALQRGDRAREQGKAAEAEEAYRTALTLHASNERALQGLRLLDQHQRLGRILKAAEAAMARSDWVNARARLQEVLHEEPRHRRASELLHRVTEAARVADESAEPNLSEAYRKPISIEFRDTPIKTVFEVLARSSGLNFVFDKEVRADQKVSVYLKNSSVEAAVNTVLATNQLDQKVIDAHTVMVYPNTPAKQKEYQPLAVRSFYLANADAKTVSNTLKSLLKMRDVVADEKLNLVIVRDTRNAIRVAEKVVALHDVPEAEVMLEVEVMEVKRTRLLDLGVRWPEQLSLTPLPAATGGTLTLADLRHLNASGVGATLGSASINARKSDTDANILANPRIRARNREKAKIHIGERVPNITTTSTSTGFVSESVNYVDVGLKLDVEPTIYLDDEVGIKITLEVSSIISQVQTKSGTLAYQIGTRSATTVLRLKDGENQVLAGLISDEERSTANKLPGLGEVPLLGRLFGNSADDANKTEVVLSITPRVVRNLHRPAAAAQEFDSGTESEIGGRGTDRGAGAAAPVGQRMPGAVGEPGNAPPAMPTTANSSTGVGSGSTAATPAATATGMGMAEVISGTMAGAGVVQAQWIGPSKAQIGQTLKIEVLLRADEPVMAAPMVIGLDPQVFQVTGVGEGPFLRQGGAVTGFSSQVDPSGKVTITASRAGASGATAPAVAAELTLKVLARPPGGTTRIALQSLAAMGVNGQALRGQLPPALELAIQP